MTSIPIAIQVILGIFGVTVIGGVLWVAARSSYSDAQMKRMRGENEDYLRRLNYVEPRLSLVEKQNELLMSLHNPSSFQDRTDTSLSRIQTLLDEQHGVLADIRTTVSVPTLPKDKR